MRKLAGIILLFFVTLGLAFSASAKSSKLQPIYNPAGNMVLGNPTGSITLVEFFDYNCGYCRMMFPKLNQLVAQNNNIRVVFREYPVLSDRSLLPAEAALAAQKQGKYMAMHDAMMNAMQPLDQDEIVKIGQQIGLNTDKLVRDMQSPAVTQQIQQNLNIGKNMNIQGVPTFIVARTNPPSKQQPNVVTGPSFTQLKTLISQA